MRSKIPKHITPSQQPFLARPPCNKLHASRGEAFCKRPIVFRVVKQKVSLNALPSKFATEFVKPYETGVSTKAPSGDECVDDTSREIGSWLMNCVIHRVTFTNPLSAPGLPCRLKTTLVLPHLVKLEAHGIGSLRLNAMAIKFTSSGMCAVIGPLPNSAL